MPDENGTKATRPDAVSVEEQDAGSNVEQDPQDAADVGDKSDAGESADAEAETGATDELKVVVSIKGGRAVIGVQQPSSDPHIETFDDADLPALAQEVTAVAERARARWEEAPKHPAHERPAPSAKRRNNRRQQGAAQDANAGGAAEQEQAQQTLRLF